MSNSIHVDPLIQSIATLMRCAKELDLAVHDLKNATEEMKRLEDCHGDKVE